MSEKEWIDQYRQLWYNRELDEDEEKADSHTTKEVDSITIRRAKWSLK